MKMDRARMVSPKEVQQAKIVMREWGIERCYKTLEGFEICTPAPFDLSFKLHMIPQAK